MSSVLSRTSFSGLTEKCFRVFAASQSKFSSLVTLILVCLSAWLAGQTIWYFLAEKTVVSKWSAQPVNAQISSESEGVDVSTLLDAALFGRQDEQVKNVVAAPVVQDAPKTRLNLVLVGAVSSSVMESSLAVIANQGSQATYGIGEKIEGTQAKLKRVFIDRVIIDNAGRDETLMLEGIDYKKVSPPEAERASNAAVREVGNNPEPSESEMESIRAEVLEDPQKILQYIRLSQVKKDGKLIGYRIRPGKQRALFDSAGLKNGDIATSLNGEDLTDPASMGKVWQSMSEMTEFNLTVERDGQTHEVFIAF
ncbi:type II secretion system protein GspC [Vibrio algarum]|uniref:Type II secretion system protein GspC n=1 Tax=Vibrio algarum TaxID=3020714 RepID=A0ABT4YMW5_9VIBR|nr:type II secretion system protein GspC [Vibrio sp. KJ40-1]MDB1122503.1 type II secretion system protein GspC [Vibrio sp. KJ40-1]